MLQEATMPGSLFTYLGIKILDPLDTDFSISVSLFLVTEAMKS